MNKKQLKRKREELVVQLKEIGFFRRGSLNEVYRKCGKSNCHCSRPGDPGHGPQHTLTFKQDGQSRIRVLGSFEARKRAKEQVASHDRFVEWSREFLAVNEQLCDQELEAAHVEGGKSEESPEKKLRKRSKQRRPKRSDG